MRSFVAAERVHQFSGVIVSEHRRVARDEDVSVLVLEDDPDFGASVVVHVLCVLRGRQSADLKVKGGFFVAVGDGLGVRGFTIVGVTEASADADDGGGELLLTKEPAGDVRLVYALVAEVAVPVVPDPVPVVVELFAEQVNFWGGAAPKIEVEALGDGLWAGDLFDGTPRLVAGPASVFEFAEWVAFQPFDGGLEATGGAALGPALDDSVVFEGGCGQLSAFPNGVGDGLFDVNIFTGLCGPDCGEGVPMIGGRDHDGVDVLAFEEASNVVVGRDGLSGVIGILFEDRFTVCDAFCVHIAEGHEARILCVKCVFEDAGAASADSDAGDADGVVRALGTEE